MNQRNRILEQFLGTSNESEIISTWVGEENPTIKISVSGFLKVKETLENGGREEVKIIHNEKNEGKHSWMDFTVFEFYGIKVVQQAGMPDNYWFKRSDMLNLLLMIDIEDMTLETY